MRDLGQYLPSFKKEKYLRGRSGYNTESESVTIEAIERAIKAEAEVERLRLMVTSITGGLDEAIESNHYLEKQLESAVCDLEMLMEYPDGCKYCAHYTDENDDTQCALDKKYGAGTCSAKWRG